MSPSRTPRRVLPAILFALALTACSGSSTTPAVDSKVLQERLDAFVTEVTKTDAGSDFAAKADGAAKVVVDYQGCTGLPVLDALRRVPAMLTAGLELEAWIGT